MADSGEPAVFCINHPGRETGLRCNRCGDPICAQCAVRTPVGYRCKKCVREQQKTFETALWYDFPVAFLVSAVLFGAGSLLSSVLGFWVIFVAAAAGALTARAVQFTVRYRRSRYLWIAAAAGGIAGCMPVLLVGLIGFALAGLTGILTLIWPGAYLVIALGALIASIRGIRL
jgi:hypothetical protein